MYQGLECPVPQCTVIVLGTTLQKIVNMHGNHLPFKSAFVCSQMCRFCLAVDGPPTILSRCMFCKGARFEITNNIAGRHSRAAISLTSVPAWLLLWTVAMLWVQQMGREDMRALSKYPRPTSNHCRWKYENIKMMWIKLMSNKFKGSHH